MVVLSVLLLSIANCIFIRIRVIISYGGAHLGEPKFLSRLEVFLSLVFRWHGYLGKIWEQGACNNLQQ